MVIHQVKLATTLSETEARSVMEERAARTREVSGLLQTHYQGVRRRTLHSG